jgi:two-component system cell cycle sensor histidine kinase/response regulator CckA
MDQQSAAQSGVTLPRTRESGLGALLDRSPIAALVIDADTLDIIHANAAAQALVGPLLDGAGVTLPNLFPSTPLGHSHAYLRPLRDGLVKDTVVETSMHGLDGNSRAVEIHLSYSPDPSPRYMGLILNVSGRSAVDDLTIRRERLRDALAEILRAITRIENRDDLYHEACRIAVERGGFHMAWIGLIDNESGEIVPVASAGHVAGYLDVVRVSVRDVPNGRGMAGRALRSGQPVVIADARTDPRFQPWLDEGQARNYQSAVALPLNVEGRVVGGLMVYASVINAFEAIEVELLQHLANDISFKVEVIGREELRQAAETELDRRAAVVEQATESVLMTDQDGRISYANAAFSQITGYEQREVLGRLPDFLLSDSLPGETASAIGRAILDGGTWTGRSIDRLKDGSERQMALIVAPRRDRSGAVVGSMIIGRDVSRERALEAQLMQSQKLEAIGRFAGGIAHDFNNLLTAIAGYAEILKAEIDSNDPRADDVVEIQRAAARATQLTAQLLAFSRRQVLNPRPLDPQSVVTGIAPMLRRLMGEEVELAVSAQPGLGPVLADPGQLDQVLVNLALNARDAMPRGGHLDIEVHEVDLDSNFARAHGGSEAGTYVVFEVRDAGVGMGPQILGRAFEPFFTTKAPGKGTGLGLSTVIGIVEQSSGYVDVESELGRGTTVRVYLPKTLAQEVKTPDETDDASPRGRGTLLVVEDEETIRSFLCRILEQAGYSVIQAATGEQALEIEAGYAGQIDLLFTDVVMPGMSGRELADILLTRRPGTPVLYASGYNEEMIADRGVLGPGVGYLPKPYTRAEILQRLRDLLKSRATLDGD